MHGYHLQFRPRGSAILADTPEQQLRHGLETDPLREITVLPDLLGLRLLGDHAIGNVRRFLPRVSREQLLKRLVVPSLEPIVDATPEECLPAGLGASCLPALRGSTAEETGCGLR